MYFSPILRLLENLSLPILVFYYHIRLLFVANAQVIYLLLLFDLFHVMSNC